MSRPIPLSPDAARLLAEGERLRAQGMLAAAIGRFEDATLLAGRSAAPWQALGNALAEANRPGEAVVALLCAAACADVNDALADQAGQLLRHVLVADPAQVDRAGLIACLQLPGIDHQPFVKQAVLLLKHGALAPVLQVGRQRDWPAAADWLLSAAGRGARENALLLTMLRQAINTDVELELLLTAARARLLAAVPDRKGFDFLQAMAWQAANNDWVWSESPGETQAADALQEAVERSLAGAASLSVAAEGQLLQLALYRPPHRLAGIAGLRRGRRSRISARLADFLAATVWPRLEEIRLAPRVPRFAAIEDATSQAVQAQYEDDPYPRWLGLTRGSPAQEARALAQFFAAGELAALGEPRQVLIAGCGTGRHALEAAFRYGPDVAITAIDLSAGSLAYASRMAKFYQVENVTFVQGDLLMVDRLQRQFDIVESVGVLHHLRDPAAGLRALVRSLRPGGLIKLGFYSRVARAEILAARAEIASRGLPPTPDAIRGFRRELLAGSLATVPWRERILQAWDFFNLGDCRDLLFHVQEHDYSLPEITFLLRTAGLDFRGFTLPPATAAAFRRESPAAAATDLAAWQEFEARHPETFIGMYRFWCYRP